MQWSRNVAPVLKERYERFLAWDTLGSALKLQSWEPIIKLERLLQEGSAHELFWLLPDQGGDETKALYAEFWRYLNEKKGAMGCRLGSDLLLCVARRRGPRQGTQPHGPTGTSGRRD